MSDAIEALRLYEAYLVLPTDRGGKKGQAHAAFIAAKDRALAAASVSQEVETKLRADIADLQRMMAARGKLINQLDHDKAVLIERIRELEAAVPASGGVEAAFQRGLDAAAEYLLACDDYGDRLKAEEIRKIKQPLPSLPPYQATGYASGWHAAVATWRGVRAKPASEPAGLVRDSSPDDIRKQGWTVAVHNDYRLNGQANTFWLFTKDGRAIKGEGRSDAEALNAVRVALSAPASSSPAEATD